MIGLKNIIFHSIFHILDSLVTNVLHEVYFPSILFILKRLELVRSLRTGVAICDIGLGFDHFLEVL